MPLKKYKAYIGRGKKELILVVKICSVLRAPQGEVCVEV